jgi:plastocyanin
MKQLLFLLAAGGLALAANAKNVAKKVEGAPPPANQESAVAALGSIKGNVVFDGERPEPKADIKPTEKESAGCHHTGEYVVRDESLRIDDKGGVADVVLSIEVAGAKIEVPKDAVIFDQKGCTFTEHVKVVPIGALVRFANSDETNHNIHLYAKKNEAVNKNIAGGQSFDLKLDKSEVVEVKCDIHTWMRGYVVVTEASHWDISGLDGTFEIKDLPAGTYKVNVWHPELGKSSTEIVVEAGKETAAEVKVGAKKEGGERRKR